MPTTKPSFLAYPLVQLTRFCVQRPIAILVVAMLFAVIGGLSAFNCFDRTNPTRSTAINDSQGKVRLNTEFDDSRDVIVSIEGNSSQKMVSVLEELSQKIETHQHLFQSALSGIDYANLYKKGLYFLSPDELKQINLFVRNSNEIVHKDWARLNLDRMLHSIMERLRSPESVLQEFKQTGFSGISARDVQQDVILELDRVSLSLSQAFSTKPQYVSPWIPSPWEKIRNSAQIPEQGPLYQQGTTGYFLFHRPDNGQDQNADSTNTKVDKAKTVDSVKPNQNTQPQPNEPIAPAFSGFVLVRLAETPNGQFYSAATEAIEKLNDILNETREKYPDFQFRLADSSLISSGESLGNQSVFNSTVVSAFLGTVFVLIVVFGGVRYSLMILFSLMIAAGWTFGTVSLLNDHGISGYGYWDNWNRSIPLGLIALGIGLGFLVHYLSQYMNLRQSIRSPKEAITQTAATVGPGIGIGSIASFAALLIFGVFDQSGVECSFGYVGTIGILSCAICATIILPVLIQVADGQRPMRPVSKPLDFTHLINPVFRYPRITLLLTLLLFCCLLYQSPYSRNSWTALFSVDVQKNAEANPSVSSQLERQSYGGWLKFPVFDSSTPGNDGRLLKTKPSNNGMSVANAQKAQATETTNLQDEIVFGVGGPCGPICCSTASSPEELLKRKSELLQHCPGIHIAEIASIIPKSNKSKQLVIASIANQLNQLPESPTMVPLSRPEQVVQSLSQLQSLLGTGPQSRIIVERLESVKRSLQEMPASSGCKRMQDYQNAIATDLLSRLRTLRQWADPVPPNLNDLPKALVDQFVDQSGKHLMRISLNKGIADSGIQQQFLQRIREIDPNAVGNFAGPFEPTQKPQQSRNVILCGAVVLVLFLWIMFGSIVDTALCLTPIIYSLGTVFGFVGLLGISADPSDIIVSVFLVVGLTLPVSVRIVHDFRQQDGQRCMSAATACSVIVAILTLLICFGSMIFTSEAMLQQTGQMGVIGSMCVIFSLMVVLPSLLSLRIKNQPDILALPTPVIVNFSQEASNDKEDRIIRLDIPHLENAGKAQTENNSYLQSPLPTPHFTLMSQKTKSPKEAASKETRPEKNNMSDNCPTEILKPDFDSFYAQFDPGKHVPIADPIYDQQYVDQQYDDSYYDNYHPLSFPVPDDKPKRLRRRKTA